MLGTAGGRVRVPSTRVPARSGRPRARHRGSRPSTCAHHGHAAMVSPGPSHTRHQLRPSTVSKAPPSVSAVLRLSGPRHPDPVNSELSQLAGRGASVDQAESPYTSCSSVPGSTVRVALLSSGKGFSRRSVSGLIWCRGRTRSTPLSLWHLVRGPPEQRLQCRARQQLAHGAAGATSRCLGLLAAGDLARVQQS